jgi:cytochrome c peroxidase
MKNQTLYLLFAAGLAVTTCSVREEPARSEILELPQTPFQYRGTTDHVGTLGRVLFYDRNLSVNNSLACSSCHKQSLAFADNVALSAGFENRVARRNSMPIQNLSGNGTGIDGVDDGFPSQTGIPLFWDGRETQLNSMVLKPITNHVEMGVGDLNALCQKLKNVSYYPALFTNAFGSEDITPERIGEALKGFVGSISSAETKFDKSRMGSAQLTALEDEGRQLFKETYDCNQCHQVDGTHGYIMAGTFANIGLDAEYADQGRAEVSQSTWDRGRFKIPSLRNVALTAPYMHDGRFATLDDVIEHYSDEIQDNENLDFRLRDRENGQPLRLDISEHDKSAIIAFLNTLTDQNMISDVRFSNPFKTK